MMTELCVEYTGPQALIQEIRAQLESMTKIPMVLANKATTWFGNVRKLAHVLRM
jgi:hypothetical protein